MIKKIVITGKGKNNSNYFRIYRIGYTIPIDGAWTNKWLVGTNVTKSTTTTYICNEFTATASPATDGSNIFKKMFDGSASTYCCTDNFTITIIFNQPIPAIKNIMGCYFSKDINSYYINGFEAYDENDGLLFSNNTTWKNNTSLSVYNTYYLETPDLETTKVYPTNKVGTVETTDACHITDIYSIDVINFTNTMPDNTDIRYLLSFDGRNTYKTYDTTSGSWITVNTTDIMTQGLTSSELLALRSSEYLLAVDTNYRTLDIIVGLITTDETRTPCVNSVRVSYYKITT